MKTINKNSFFAQNIQKMSTLIDSYTDSSCMTKVINIVSGIVSSVSLVSPLIKSGVNRVSNFFYNSIHTSSIVIETNKTSGITDSVNIASGIVDNVNKTSSLTTNTASLSPIINSVSLGSSIISFIDENTPYVFWSSGKNIFTTVGLLDNYND